MSPVHSQAGRSVRAWDLPTRLFHWALVVLIASAWISHRYSGQLGDNLLVWHRWNGYSILVLIVFRLLWGFAGSSTSRFTSFVRGPGTAIGYGLDLLRGRRRHFLGHNPLGTLMILALLAAVATQGVFGLFTLEHNEVVAGPLKRIASDAWVEFFSKWHVRGFNLILMLVAVHVAANVLYALVLREPLIGAMITGKKPAGAYEDAAEAEIRPGTGTRAAVCLLAAAGIVFGGILALGGRLW